MSKKKADAAAAPKQNEANRKVYPKEYGLSISTPDRGFNMVPGSWQMCEEIFDVLYERFDEEMMKKRVEREYLKYSI